MHAYVGANPVSNVDPTGLDALIVSGHRRDDSLNVMGHVGQAMTGWGMYSYGNGTNIGSGVLSCLVSQCAVRDQTVVFVPTTVGQDLMMLGYYSHHPQSNDVRELDNCARRVGSALKTAGLPVESAWPHAPATSVSFAQNMPVAQTFFIPQGGPISQELLNVLRSFENWHC